MISWWDKPKSEGVSWSSTLGTWRSSWCCQAPGRACKLSPYRFHHQHEEDTHIWSNGIVIHVRQESSGFRYIKHHVFSPEWIDVRGNGVKSHTVQLCSLNQELEGNVRLRRSCLPWGHRKWQEYRPEDCESSELRKGFLLHAWTCRSCCCTYWTRTCYFTF